MTLNIVIAEEDFRLIYNWMHHSKKNYDIIADAFCYMGMHEIPVAHPDHSLRITVTAKMIRRWAITQYHTTFPEEGYKDEEKV